MPPESGPIQNDPLEMLPQEPIRQRDNDYSESTRIARKKLFYLLINSTAAFILTYFLSYLFYQFVVMYFASMLGIPFLLYYFEIHFGIANTSPEWSMTRILAVSAGSPFFSLFGGCVILFVAIKNFPLQQYHKLFLLWLGFQLLNTFFGGLIAGSITGHGLGYTLDLFFWPVYFIYAILIIIAICCLAGVGYDFTDHFLSTSPSSNWSKRKNKAQYLLFTLLLPWLIGSLLIFLIKIPDSEPQHDQIALHDLIVSLSMIFLILPMFFRRRNTRIRVKTLSADRKRNIWWSLVIATILFVMFFRIGLTGFFYSLFI